MNNNIIIHLVLKKQICNLFYFLYECLNLGAVPRMGRQSRCTHPFWVFASFFVCVCVCVCVVLQIYIVFTRGPPNKAVKKKAFFGPVFCALFKMQSLFLLKPLLSFRSAHVTWTAGLPCTGQLTRYQSTNCSRTEIQHLSDLSKTTYFMKAILLVKILSQQGLIY